LPSATSPPQPTDTPLPPPTSTPQPTDTPQPTHVPPGQTRTPPGLTHQPNRSSNSETDEEFGSGENEPKLPLALVVGSVGLFFTVQATAERIRLRPRRKR
jgi:hypothetical protein